MLPGYFQGEGGEIRKSAYEVLLKPFKAIFLVTSE
jgi:hypothetical protein